MSDYSKYVDAFLPLKREFSVNKKRTGYRCVFKLSDDVEDKGENYESDGNPLGSLSKLCIQGTTLILGHEGLGNTADGAGEAGTLTGLEENDENNCQCADELENGDKELHIKQTILSTQPAFAQG